MNKKIISMILLALIALSLPQAVNAAGDYAYLAEVTSTSFLPETIHAGDVVSIAVDIKNKGTSYSIEDFNAELDLARQFEPVETTENLEVIIAGATKTIVFKFRVKENTLPGYYNVLLNMNYLRTGEEVNQTQNISVPVSGTEKNLDVVIEPKVINPGKQTELIFTLTNIGGTPVSNISLSWEEENDLVLPLGSDNKRYISLIEAGGAVSVSYTVAADPNISTGIYPLDINISFIDVDGTKTQKSQVGLIIGGTTDFEVSAETSSGQLSLSIANIGSNNASSVVVKIPKQTGITITGSDTQILGNLNKGDYTIANFSLGGVNAFTAENTTAEAPTRSLIRIPGTGRTQGEQTSDETQTGNEEMTPNMNFNANELTVQIEYTDTTGERQITTKKVSLSSGATATTGFVTARQTGNQNLIPGIVLLVLVVGGGILFNKFKAKKNWKKTGIVLGGITALYLISIFFLNFDLIGLLLVSVFSVVLLWWYFFKFEEK